MLKIGVLLMSSWFCEYFKLQYTNYRYNFGCYNSERDQKTIIIIIIISIMMAIIVKHLKVDLCDCD